MAKRNLAIDRKRKEKERKRKQKLNSLIKNRSFDADVSRLIIQKNGRHELRLIRRQVLELKQTVFTLCGLKLTPGTFVCITEILENNNVTPRIFNRSKIIETEMKRIANCDELPRLLISTERSSNLFLVNPIAFLDF